MIQSNGPHPDLPLTFSYMPGDCLEIMRRLKAEFSIDGLKPKLRQEALLAIVAETVMAAKINRSLSFSCASDWYTGRWFYNGKHFTQAHIIGAITDTEGSGMFNVVKAKPGAHWHTGLQSTITATPALVECYGDMRTDQVQQQPLRMKDCDEADGKSRLITYDENRFTVEKRDKIQRVNSMLWNVDVNFDPIFDRQGQLVNVEGDWVWPRRVQLHSVHTRGSWNCHGRLYGWHTNLRKIVRRHLLIDGETTAEVDYTACHPHMLYAQAGIQLNQDIYDHGMFFSRDTWKTVFNISVNAKNEASAAHAIKDDLDHSPGLERFYMIMMEQFMEPIEDKLYSDAGIFLQRIDSDIILDVMATLVDQGIPGLPVHDSVIVPRRYSARTAQVMTDTYSKYFPNYTISAKINL